MEVNGTIFVQIFIFLTLLLWLSPVLFAPIMKLFDERERRISGAQEQAEIMSKLALEKSQTFDVEYEKARIEARDVLTELKRLANVEQAEHFARVKLEARKKLEIAQKELAISEKLVQEQLKDASTAIANDIVDALLGQRV